MSSRARIVLLRQRVHPRLRTSLLGLEPDSLFLRYGLDFRVYCLEVEIGGRQGTDARPRKV